MNHLQRRPDGHCKWLVWACWVSVVRSPVPSILQPANVCDIFRELQRVFRKREEDEFPLPQIGIRLVEMCVCVFGSCPVSFLLFCSSTVDKVDGLCELKEGWQHTECWLMPYCASGLGWTELVRLWPCFGPMPSHFLVSLLLPTFSSPSLCVSAFTFVSHTLKLSLCVDPNVRADCTHASSSTSPH